MIFRRLIDRSNHLGADFDVMRPSSSIHKPGFKGEIRLTHDNSETTRMRVLKYVRTREQAREHVRERACGGASVWGRECGHVSVGVSER